MSKIQITTPGIKKALSKYKYPRAIAQYVWNGFDAQASSVEIVVNANEMGFIEEFSVTDNGYGIPFEELEAKFKPFFESEKEIDPDVQRENSAIHGKNGVGRLTFFQFAIHAKWETVYERDGNRFEYSIDVFSDDLETYIPSEVRPSDEPIGTSVMFSGISELTAHNFDTDIAEFLMISFGWFLELNKDKYYSLMINGELLDYSFLMGDAEEFGIDVEGQSFLIRYIRWKEFLSEYSRYYFLDSKGEEVFKKTTTLNNKGDSYYHSVYIHSDFFDMFKGSVIRENVDEHQLQMFSTDQGEEIFKQLLEFVDKFLRDKRRPFLKLYTDKLVNDFVEEKAFPEYTDNEWDQYRREELENVVRELYQVEPRIFVKLNAEQKRTFVHLLDLVMDAGERDRLLSIIDEIVNLDPDEREQLEEILISASLSNIVKTIKLIEDRYRAVDELKNLVFSPEYGANEPDHIQKFIENHYWIFGEQYHLVTAAEPKFEEALRRYLYLLRGEKEDVEIDHPDKKKEMDIFMVRQDIQNDIINNVVVELKHPRIGLGSKELGQVKQYMAVILKQPEFNASNMHWEFVLVGNKFDSSGYIEGEIENSKNHGERSLAFKREKYKIYVRTWSEIFVEFETRHKFLNEKLQLERHELISEYQSADEIIQNVDTNVAIQPPEVAVPD